MKCNVCGTELFDIYTDNGKKFKTCEKCRLRNRTAKRNFDKKKRFVRDYATLSLDETLKELRSYNIEHNVNLSYGMFIALKEQGKLKQDCKK